MTLFIFYLSEGSLVDLSRLATRRSGFEPTSSVHGQQILSGLNEDVEMKKWEPSKKFPFLLGLKRSKAGKGRDATFILK